MARSTSYHPTNEEIDALAARIKPMEYHGPGWTLEHKDVTYYLWAPQSEPPKGGTVNKLRDHWSACWERDGGLSGDYLDGASAGEVMRIFSPLLGNAFARAAGVAL